MAPTSNTIRKPGDRKRAVGEETVTEGENKRTPEETLAKYPFVEPKDDDKCAEFSQHFMSYQQRGLFLTLCDECARDTQGYSKQVHHNGKSCLTVVMCRSCIHTARRNSQTMFFNITLKNLHDKIQSGNH